MRRFAVVPLLALTLTLGVGQASLARQAATPAAGASASPAACPTTTEDENTAVARAFHEEVINQGNLSVLQDILAPDVVHHMAGGYADVTTAAGVSDMMDDFPAAFSDLHYTIDFVIAKDDFVVERYTATGTQTGPLGDLPPSGKTATWTGINIFRFECGKIAEIWSEVDALSRMQQLTGEAMATPAP
jgi:steroid delta-isomerase-like uncharacterized protein